MPSIGDGCEEPPDIFFFFLSFSVALAIKAKGERGGWAFRCGVRRLIREAGKDEAAVAEQRLVGGFSLAAWCGAESSLTHHVPRHGGLPP